ncbi:hypothetical protein EIN_457840 [Entamoeba invadens IP1]|uniref:CCHC-type domain-containing protein n=1 Tax=Entamoeba invadens IP1 TaxID=370355 RepID=A0A0A1UBD9_ENTIV|nr:hypothetical protein EIN_457840 [Entamoeba invadens IP1]ELP89525.1 hypothetical protein EIN_457840 [Entamoeba invadens IP1]|eukprot:XP_004256296.1 hypothetical protein EIN_457840 [Entamoeba invadens IP1]
MSDNIVVKVFGFHRTVKDEEVNQVFAKYSPLSVEIPRYNEDTPLSCCTFEVSNKNVNALISTKNGSAFNEYKLKACVCEKLQWTSKIRASHFGPNVSDEEMQNCFKEFDITNFERIVGKKGETKGNIVIVTVDDIETAKLIKKNMNKKKIGNDSFKVHIDNYEIEKKTKCFICGLEGHLEGDCPKRLEIEKSMDKKVQQSMKNTEKKSGGNIRNKDTKEIKKNSKNTKNVKKQSKEKSGNTSSDDSSSNSNESSSDTK